MMNFKTLESKDIILKILLAFILIFFNSEIKCQNLILNSNFEEVKINDPKRFYCRDLSIFEHWRFKGFALPCNCEGKSYKGNINTPLNDNCILGKSPKAYDGCNMVLMHGADYPWKDDFIQEAYIYTKFISSLQIGKVYEISCWYYLCADSSNIYSKEIMNHLGCNVSNSLDGIHENICEPDLGYFPYWELLLKDPPTFKWFQQKWYIQPTCELNYIIFGMTTDMKWNKPDDKKSIYGSEFKYFIDNVSVREIDSTKVEKQNIVPITFCKPKLPTPSIIEQQPILLYFNTNSYELADSSKVVLDSLAIRLKKKKIRQYKLRDILTILVLTINHFRNQEQMLSEIIYK